MPPIVCSPLSLETWDPSVPRPPPAPRPGRPAPAEVTAIRVCPRVLSNSTLTRRVFSDLTVSGLYAMPCFFPTPFYFWDSPIFHSLTQFIDLFWRDRRGVWYECICCFSCSEQRCSGLFCARSLHTVRWSLEELMASSWRVQRLQR